MESNTISVNDILNKNNIKLEETVYTESTAKMLDFRIVSKDFYEPVKRDNDRYTVYYKNAVEISNFKNIEELIPALSGINYSGKYNLPYFISGLEGFSEKVNSGERVAIEGGPCLFGTDEVIVSVERKGGRTDYFDYNTGKSYSLRTNDRQYSDFGDFMLKHGSEVVKIDFEDRKKGLTPQEWMFIKFPFEAARVLDAPLVIPIPDMSYIKYLEAVLINTDRKIKEKALSDFQDLTHKICDQYISVIRKLKSLYKNVSCDIVHDRNIRLLNTYYEARAPFIECKKVQRILTGIPEKTESVKDYVSMPALPYYLYGIKNILEIDSMDETDSYRKCRKAHKNSLELACILLPEFLAGDKTHTIFDAPLGWKEYGEYVIE